jgi:hypothetical protein
MDFTELKSEIEERRKISPWLDEKIREIEVPHPGRGHGSGGIKGDFQRIEALRRITIRQSDRGFFRYYLGDFINEKEIHHLWSHGDRCLLIGKQEHQKMHSGRGGKENGR